jgi:kumamolisin
VIAQLVGLERRTSRGGRDSIDHPLGSHDDVANAAGGALVLAANNNKVVGEGGTSWSAPTWAGFAALIGDALQKQGKPQMGFLGPHLYRLPPDATFRDITIGTNGGYNAAAGWDPVTGIGTPDVRAIIQMLQ